MLIGGLISLLCTWAVFSRKVDDGFIGRHFLSFAAISFFAYAWNGEPRAFLTGYLLLILFALWLPVRYLLRMSRHAH